MYEQQYKELPNARLDAMEAEDFPDRGIIRRAVEASDSAEQLLRTVLMDQHDRAEDELRAGSDRWEPDYIDDLGYECLYPESVNEELDRLIGQLWEVNMGLLEVLDES
jgi:hypothetical protein